MTILARCAVAFVILALAAVAPASTYRNGPLPPRAFSSSRACMAELRRMQRTPSRFDADWRIDRLRLSGRTLVGTHRHDGLFWQKRLHCRGASMRGRLIVSQWDVDPPTPDPRIVTTKERPCIDTGCAARAGR